MELSYLYTEESLQQPAHKCERDTVVRNCARNCQAQHWATHRPVCLPPEMRHADVSLKTTRNCWCCIVDSQNCTVVIERLLHICIDNLRVDSYLMYFSLLAGGRASIFTAFHPPHFITTDTCTHAPTAATFAAAIAATLRNRCTEFH